MKKLLPILLAIGLLACLFPLSALADDTTDTGSYLYFDGAYRDGRVTNTIKKGNTVKLRFTVVDSGVEYANFYNENTDPVIDYRSTVDSYYSSSALPLQKDDDTISVTPGQTKGGKMEFEVEIPARYTGTGNSLSFTIFYSAQDSSGKEITRTLDCNYNVTACKETSSTTSDDDDDKNKTPITPYIIVSSYSYGGSSVTAGQNFTLSMTLRNTSSEYDLNNIIMNVTPQGVFSVASSSNTVYLESLPAGETVDKEIVIKAGMSKLTDEDDSNTINLTFKFQYETDDTRYNGDSSESITIPVDYPDRFELGMLEQSTDIYVGDECYLYLPMVNKGRSSVYNLTVAVEGDMDKSGQSQYIGNLSAGTENGADFSVTFSEPGEKSGTIVVTYEDANSDLHTLRQPFSVNVMEMEEPTFDPGMDIPTDIDDPGMIEPENTLLSKRNIAIAAGVLVVVIIGVVIHRKRKAERAVGDEEI